MWSFTSPSEQNDYINRLYIVVHVSDLRVLAYSQNTGQFYETYIFVLFNAR